MEMTSNSSSSTEEYQLSFHTERVIKTLKFVESYEV